MISVENLSYVYENNIILPIKAIDNISFSVSDGEVLGIIGKTGSGKSTLARILNGLLKPTRGKIFLNGRDINKDFKSSKDIFFKIGLVFQYPEHQLFQKTVFDDIAFGLRNKGISEEKIKFIVEETIEILGIDKNILKSSPLILSGGEKRKCAIAGIMALRPDVLILDEPTAGMDFKGRKNLINCLKNYCQGKKNSVIFISHVIDEIAQLSTNILVMEAGRSVLYGSSKEVFNNKNILEKIDLKIPQISKIMELIKNSGYNVDENIITTDDAKKEILKLLKERGNT